MTQKYIVFRDELESKLETKVDKETGKGLIESSKVTKLDGIEEGAQVNKLESLKVNNVTLPIVGKTTDLSSLDNVIEKIKIGTTEQTVTDKTVTLPVYTKDEADSYLLNKVDKETGKGLSSNDFTNTLKTKLENVTEGAQVNIIEGIKVNGTISPVTDKVVDITIPSAPVQGVSKKGTPVTPDANGIVDLDFLTEQEIAAAVANYGYQTSAQVQAAINSAIAEKGGITITTVENLASLPEVGKPNVIYLVKDIGETEADGSPKSAQYLYVEGEWEVVGSGSTNLDGYLKTDDADTKYATKQDVTAVQGELQSKATKAELAGKVDTATYTTDMEGKADKTAVESLAFVSVAAADKGRFTFGKDSNGYYIEDIKDETTVNV